MDADMDADTPKAPLANKKILVVAFCTIFLDLLGFGLIIPIQPFYAKALGASATIVTILSAVYSIMQFFFSPFWGALSDKIGRKPIILFSILISAVGHVLFAMASGLGMLFLARIVTGFGNANIGVAQAIIADVTTKENRSKGMALIGIAFGFGFLLGPAIGGFLGTISPQMPFWVAGGLSLVNWVFALVFLQETRPKEKEVDGNGHQARKVFDWKVFAKSQQYLNVSNLLWMTLLYTVSFALMEQAISLYIESVWVTDIMLTDDERIKQAGLQTAYFLIAVGITAIFVQGGAIGPLTKKFREINLIRWGLAIVMVAMVLIPVLGDTQNYRLFLLSSVILAIGTGISNPSRQAFLSQSVPDEEQGAILGLNQSMGALGRALGPAVAGYIFEMQATLPFYIAAVILLLTLPMAWRLQPLSMSSSTETTTK